MTTLDDQRRAAGLKPLPRTHVEVEAKPDVVTEDATIGNEERLRGIPAVGRVSGTMKGTRPGDQVRALMEEIDELYEQALQRRAEGKVKRTRRRHHREDRIDE